MSSKTHLNVSAWRLIGAAALATTVGWTAVPQAHASPRHARVCGTDADNTERNVRDRDHNALNPMDQGNNETDLRITQQIRKNVVARDDLSVNAHNVKIITLNGQVTLRGPVKSAQEKATIAELAKQVAGVKNVDNQIEIEHESYGDSPATDKAGTHTNKAHKQMKED